MMIFLILLSFGSALVPVIGPNPATSPLPTAPGHLFVRTDTLPAPARNPLAPGNAHIRAEIIQLDNSETATILTVKIIRIDGYGSATPPLTPDRILKVDATAAARLTPDRKPFLERGGRLNAIIRHQPELKPEATDPAWTLETFSPDEHTQEQPEK